MKHVLVIGASRGLGLALVKTALEAGVEVTALSRSPAPRLVRLKETSPRLSVGQADVRSEAELERFAGRLDPGTVFDVLIYNAAVHLEQDRRDIAEARPDDILETLDVNAVGAARAVKHLRPFVANNGLIALISSEAGSISDAPRGSEYGYCMSKAALNMLTKLLINREAQTRGGRGSAQVFALHPGWVRTDMGGANADISPEESARDILSTLDARLSKPGPPFVDRFNQPMRW